MTGNIRSWIGAGHQAQEWTVAGAGFERGECGRSSTHPLAEGLSYYRRRIVVLVKDGTVAAGMEDDYHHFQVALTHDGRRVTSVRGEAIRFPWVICPGASAELQRVVGASLTSGAMRSADAFDRFSQCTHQLDLALLAIHRAGMGAGVRFDVAISRPAAGEHRVVTLLKDGVSAEEWWMNGEEIVAPSELAGCSIRRLRPWAEALDDDRFEQIAVLRRCLQVASSGDREVKPEAASKVVQLRNACYAYQDVRSHQGLFIPESMLDFSRSPDELLRDFP